jgi:hypothetical protein
MKRPTISSVMSVARAQPSAPMEKMMPATMNARRAPTRALSTPPAVDAVIDEARKDAVSQLIYATPPNSRIALGATVTASNALIAYSSTAPRSTRRRSVRPGPSSSSQLALVDAPSLTGDGWRARRPDLLQI